METGAGGGGCDRLCVWGKDWVGTEARRGVVLRRKGQGGGSRGDCRGRGKGAWCVHY
jgi:hypothetical protein